MDRQAKSAYFLGGVPLMVAALGVALTAAIVIKVLTSSESEPIKVKVVSAAQPTVPADGLAYASLRQVHG